MRRPMTAHGQHRSRHMGRRVKGAPPVRVVEVRKHYRRLGGSNQQQELPEAPLHPFDSYIAVQAQQQRDAAFLRWVLGHLEGGANPGRFTSTDSRFKAAFRNLATAGLVTLGPESDWRMAPFGSSTRPLF